MKVMVIVKATKESEAGVMPDEKTITEMGKFKEELVKAGVMLGGEGLHPSRKGKRLHISGSRKALIVPSPRRRSWSTSTRSAARSTPSPCPRSISRPNSSRRFRSATSTVATAATTKRPPIPR